MSEKYNLSWVTFTEHLQLMFKDLYDEGKHCDVTLVCDDQTQFKAHKIVLRACSPVFKNIIDNNPSQHPLIYLRGIQSYEIESILQFMYLGEGRFYYERMGEFNKVAKELEVKEISNGLMNPNVEEVVTEETVMDDEEKENEPKQTSEMQLEEEYVKEETVDDDDDDAKISCKVDEPNQISDHTQSEHEGIKSSECPECEAVYTRKDSLIRHYRSIHEGIKYPCNQCDSQFTQQRHLQTHIQSIHEGIKYPCLQCNYQATEKGSLQKHIQSKHEGIRYPCIQCDSQFQEQSSLRKHIQSKHEGIKYPCNQCHSQFTDQSRLRKHIKSKHKGSDF